MKKMATRKDLSVYRHIMVKLQRLDEWVSQRQSDTLPSRSRRIRVSKNRSLKAPSLKVTHQEGVRLHERIAVSGQAAIITKEKMLEVQITNISASGLYVQGGDKGFGVADEVRLKVRPQGCEELLKSIATVVRVDDLGNGLRGYALRFVVPSYMG